MTDLHTCMCGQSATFACTFCDEWFCEACYEQKHPDGEHIAMSDSFEILESLYGPLAPYSEHKRGDHITYTSAEGDRKSGTILWVCAPSEIGNVKLGLRYLIAPDEPTAFVDVALPGDVITSNEET
jgi:hypothetical protein